MRVAGSGMPAPSVPAETETEPLEFESTDKAEDLLNALGGRENVAAVEAIGTRLVLELENPEPAGHSHIVDLGFRGLVGLSGGKVQLLLQHNGSRLADALRKLL